jgi:polysaccharide biosynthesis/export protein
MYSLINEVNTYTMIKVGSMKYFKILVFFIIPIYFFSCKPQQKMPYYLEHVNDTTGKGKVQIPEVLIQKNDVLAIQITSLSTEPKADAIFNPPVESGSVQGGYLVDLNGNIIHHRLGTIHVEGLTKEQVAVEIKNRLIIPVELLRDPTVMVKLVNFKVNILGEVARQGTLTVPGDRMTILEAIAMAGGITDYGKKSSVKIVREHNGQREVGTIDLSSKDLFISPYYNLVQNDVVMVEPTKQRQRDADQQRAFQKVTTVFSIVTATAAIVTIFTRRGN